MRVELYLMQVICTYVGCRTGQWTCIYACGRTVEALKPQHRETKGNRFPAPDFPSNFSSLCCLASYSVISFPRNHMQYKYNIPHTHSSFKPTYPTPTREYKHLLLFIRYACVLVENMYMYAYHQHVFIDGII